MIETFEQETVNGVVTFVRLVNGETATIMTKETYDKLEAEQSTPIVAGE
jgi:hypothetical protein